MNDRFARLLASVSLAIAAVSIVVAIYALNIIEERTDQVQQLTRALESALATQRAASVPLHGPPPALDPGP
jgi:hypothetical protein